MRTALALIALVAVVSAQYCNNTYICRKAGQSCSASSSLWVYVDCASGTQCNGNNFVCEARPQLGEACTPGGLSCWDADWDITCDNGKCKYADIYGPGESCKPTDVNYVNGGCLEDLTCSTTTLKCSSVAVGGACDTTDVGYDVCVAGAYCDETTSTCVSRKAAAAACDDNYQCIPSLICTSRGTNTAYTCQAPFYGKVNDLCDDSLDCGANLLCSSSGGGSAKCVAPVTDGAVCNEQSDCSNHQGCVCGTKKFNSTIYGEVDGKCKNSFDLGEGFNAQDAINAYNKLQSCADKAGCQDIWMYSELDLQSGPSQCIQKCLQSALSSLIGPKGESYNKCESSASSAVFPAVVALVALLAALMF